MRALFLHVYQNPKITFHDSPANRARFRLSGKKLIKVVVGSEKEQFSVHECKLTNKVVYFTGASKDASNTVELPEHDPGSFKILVEWVYNNSLPSLKRESHHGIGRNRWSPIQVIKLAEELSAASLRNQVSDAYINHHKSTKQFPSIEDMDFICTSLPKEANFRKYALFTLQYIIHEERGEAIERSWPNWKIERLLVSPTGFVDELLQLMRNLEPGVRVSDPRELPLCTFHEHLQDEHGNELTCKDFMAT